MPSPRVEPVTSAVRPERSKSAPLTGGSPAAARARGTGRCAGRSGARPPSACRCRRPRPCSGCGEAREARARHVEPQPVAGLEDVRRRVAADPVLGDLVRLEQLRRSPSFRVPVARAEHPLGEEDRPPVRVHVRQAQDDQSVSLALDARRRARSRSGRSPRGRGRARRSCRRARRRGARARAGRRGPGRTGWLRALRHRQHRVVAADRRHRVLRVVRVAVGRLVVARRLRVEPAAGRAGTTASGSRPRERPLALAAPLVLAHARRARPAAAPPSRCPRPSG